MGNSRRMLQRRLSPVAEDAWKAAAVLMDGRLDLWVQLVVVTTKWTSTARNSLEISATPSAPIGGDVRKDALDARKEERRRRASPPRRRCWLAGTHHRLTLVRTTRQPPFDGGARGLRPRHTPPANAGYRDGMDAGSLAAVDGRASGRRISMASKSSVSRAPSPHWSAAGKAEREGEMGIRV
jgi:hypothetical protein